MKLNDVCGLLRMMSVAEAREKIESKSQKMARKAARRRARNKYTNAQINQRNRLYNQIRTKHK